MRCSTLDVNSGNVVYTITWQPLRSRLFCLSGEDPAGGCCLRELASGPGSRSGTALAASRILTGPASQYILYWAASIGLPARSPLIRLATRRFKVRPGSIRLPGPNRGACRQTEKPNSPGGVHCPFIRRRQDFARGAFQEEKRELKVHGCTSSAVPIRRSPG